MSTRVIVCGSRGWHDRRRIGDAFFDLAVLYGSDITIVHGGAKGADRIAEQEAQKAGFLIERHLPDYERHGKKEAPLKRNEHMASLGADLCLAFWDGRSTGTAHMMTQARNAGIQVRIISKSEAILLSPDKDTASA